jgi:beta-glucosidase
VERRFPPFKAAVDAGAGNVMTAYMDLNGVPAGASQWLFTEVLRESWGFEGFVVSDANVVRNLVTHGFASDARDAAARALQAGVDMEMAIQDPAYAHLPAALEAGEVADDVLDASVRRILEAKVRLGLFDQPYVDEVRAREVLADPAHRVVARVAAERSAVLLRNEGELLPLDAGALTSVAVLGPLADSRRDTLGPWVFDFDLDETVTVLDGLRRKVGDRIRVDHASGVRPAQRTFPSMFDMFGGNAPGIRRVRRRRRAAARASTWPVTPTSRWWSPGVAEHDRRGGLAFLAGAARASAESAPGRGRHRHTGRPARDERPPAGPALGC